MFEKAAALKQPLAEDIKKDWMTVLSNDKLIGKLLNLVVSRT